MPLPTPAFAELPVIWHPLIDSVPLLEIPPPKALDDGVACTWLFFTTSLLSDKVPALRMPPPSALFTPPVIVIPLMDAVVDELTWKTRVPLPFTVSTLEPGPVIWVVPTVSVSVSGPPVRVIVCKLPPVKTV